MFQLSSRRRVWLSIAAVSTTVLLAYSARSQLGGGVPFGASFVDMPDTGFSPPDGGLAAGHRHLVAVAENRFRILTKEGTVEKDVSLDAFFSDTVFNEDVVLPTSNPGCGAVAGTFSPRALFDQASNRFFVLAGSGDHDPARSRYLLAVSRSPDPTDGFCCYDFNGSGYVDRSRFVAERTWADYLTLGVDDVAVFFGSNQMSGENFVRSRANWLEKTPLLACEAPDVLFGYADFRHDGAVAVDQAFSVQAAHSFGPTSFVDETASCSSDLDCGGGTCTFAVPVCQGSGDTCTENADCGTCPAPTCAHSNTPCDPSLPHDARCGTCPTRTCSASSGPNSGNPCASNDQCGTCGPRHCNGTMDECTSDAECGDCLKEPGTCFPLGTILGAPTCTDDAGCDEIQCLDPNPFDADPLRFCFWDSVPIPLGVCTSDADCRTCLLGVSGLCKGSTNHGEDCLADAECPGACDVNRCTAQPAKACSSDGECGICEPRTCDDNSRDTNQECTSDAQCGSCPARTCSADSPNPDKPCTADTQCGLCLGVCEFQSEFFAATFVSEGDENDAVTVWRVVDPLGRDALGAPTFRVQQKTLTTPQIKPFDNPPAAFQPDNGPTLDTGDSRLLNLVWRSSGNLWMSHNGDAGTRVVCAGGACSAVLLKEFGTRDFPDSLTVPHDLSFGQSGFSHMYPAMAVLEGNQVALGFTRSGDRELLGNPSAVVTGRFPSTPTAGGGLLPGFTVRQGTLPYRLLPGASIQPWGGYHGASAEVCAQKGAWVEGQSSCTDDLLCDERKYATTATNVFADPAPTNNVCAKSIDIDPALLPFLDVRDTTFATFEEVDREIQSDCGSVSYPGNDGSVWYKFRAPQNGDLTIDTSGSNYGTVVSVHHETGECSGLGDVACEVCEKLYSISPEDAVLRQIDVNTGLTLDTIPLTAEPVAQALHGNVFGGHGLATSPVTGELFSLICFGGECEDDHERLLAKIEVHSGLVSVVGDPGTDPRLTNLAFDRNGALYGIDRNGNLYTLSTLDGTALLVCDAGDGGSQTISFNPADGHLYHADGFSNVDFDRIDDTSTPTCGSTAIPVDGTPLDTNAPRALTYWETGGVFIWAQKGEDDEESKLFHVTASGDPFEVGTALDHATRGLAFVKCGPGDPGIRLTVAVTGGETYRIVVSECGLSTCGGDKFLRLAVNFTRRGCGSLGQTCDDLSKCTENDQCREGAGGLLECRGTTKSCVDDNECTTDSCSAATGCVNAPNTNPCNDNKPCTTNDRCNGAGTCVGGPPPNCTDGNLCTTDSCDSTTGCVNTPNANPCNDGNACTLTDTCSNGDCIGSPEVTCDDNNACTTDPTTCDPVRGCVYAPRTGACDDGNACTTGDTCVNALCVGGLAKDCDDSNVCTTDTCNPLTEDGCVHTNNTDFCDDRVFCNGKDICANGICTHPGNPCTGNAFCSNVCNEAADNCFRANQTDCNDGLDCTLSDRCVNGQCVGDSPCPTGEKCIEELDGQCVACIGVSQVQQGGAIRCGINRPCGLPVRLATNGISNAFILAGQESVDQMSLDCPSDSCRPGLSVPTGLPGLAAVCSVNKNVATVNNPTDSCSFYLFQPDRRLEMSFKTGTVAEVPITCRQSGTSTLSLKNLEIADDSGDLVPLCTEEPTATFVCDDCLAGDCISNGRVQVNDAICVLWCGLQSTLRLQAEAQGWDCLCAADCNCDGVTNVVDALCSLHRLINNGRIPGVDRCQGAAASLALGGPERVYEPVKVWVGTAEIPEGGKRKRAFVSLARQGSDQAAAVQASVQAVGGDVLKVRLVKRLRDAGFTLASGQDGSLAEFAILPPAVQPLPATGGGRLVRVVVSADTDAVALGGVEVGSPTGDLVPTE